MKKEAENQDIKILVDKLNCTENQARNALKIANNNLSLAEVIIKEYKSEKRTNYVGGNSGQVVEMPKSQYTEEFEKLMKHSDINKDKEPIARKIFTIYKNGFKIDSKFIPLSESEIKKRLETIFKNKEFPSDLFEINQNDLIDAEIHDKSDEIYKEEYPGMSRTVNLSIPVETKSGINLGNDSILFKLTLQGRNTIVKMGGCSSFSSLKSYLEEMGIVGKLFYEDKEVSWDDSPDRYKRTLLKLIQ